VRISYGLRGGSCIDLYVCYILTVIQQSCLRERVFKLNGVVWLGPFKFARLNAGGNLNERVIMHEDRRQVKMDTVLTDIEDTPIDRCEMQWS
jgi:hypothetical protein